MLSNGEVPEPGEGPAKDDLRHVVWDGHHYGRLGDAVAVDLLNSHQISLDNIL